ncbi:cellulose synthase subunit BcsC-related outer membrane protein [Methylicorpusculum sp.]|uniref:cellulose synthase subunit BcsC-related outer membrane protein n=1 Tax=Methylicorpusculum sp. TaxID=2713644 RepID=UPI00271D7D4B|nr:cellulose synthase subunit BcsC-related outer membrane protein [Methylicorpusculum sp.]MDO8845184.1 cellulose synthase subunit BcsC-related outer membrane protein [Methylicorpusculum sp.]
MQSSSRVSGSVSFSHNRVTKPLKARPKKVKSVGPCSDLGAKWDRAENLVQQDNAHAGLSIYETILQECQNTAFRMTTLDKARTVLDYEDFMQLAEIGRSYLLGDYVDRLEYEWLKDDYLNQQKSDLNVQQQSFEQLTHWVEHFNDDNIASLIGWRFFDLKDYPNAQLWFEKAAKWNPSNENARLGQALSFEKQGELNKALAITEASDNADIEIQKIVARIYKAKAWQEIDANNPIAASGYVQHAEAATGSDAETQELNAWIANNSGDYKKAAQLFDGLYQQNPSKNYASAYVQNQAQVSRDLLEKKARQEGGLLFDEYKNFHAQELYYRKQFLSAYQLAPDLFPDLANIDSAYIDAGAYGRHKSGEDGLGRLDLLRLPVVTGSYTVGGVHNFKLSLSRIGLHSGSPGFCRSAIGSLDPTLNGCKSPFSPTEKLSEALEIDFLYRKDGWFSPSIRLGSTPISGVVDPAITFDVGFIQQTQSGHWGLNVYSQPVRQSILSYTGIRDPYANQLNSPLPASNSDLEWGRVLRSGVKASGYHQFNERWNFNGSAEIVMLTGSKVADNTSLAASLGLGRNIKIRGFDYFSIGPSIMYEHYEKNLSQFTLGHGGYFSPDHYINAGFGVNFLTDEGKSFVIKGRAVAGAQIVNESSTPWFPLVDPGRGRYDKQKDVGQALDFELKGVWLATPNIQFGAGAAIRHANNFEDYTGGLFIRYFFEERKASYSTDIPEGMFSNMQMY